MPISESARSDIGVPALNAKGTTPAHAGCDKSALSSCGGPCRTFALASLISRRVNVVETSSASAIGLHSFLVYNIQYFLRNFIFN